jgi:hypothetical protein
MRVLHNAMMSSKETVKSADLEQIDARKFPAASCTRKDQYCRSGLLPSQFLRVETYVRGREVGIDLLRA